MRLLAVLLCALPVAFALLAHLSGAAAESGVGAASVPAAFASTSRARIAPAKPSLEVALLVEQARRALEGGERPRIVPRPHWDASGMAPSGLYAYRGDLGRRFTHIVVHHSDFEPAGGPEGILRYHLDTAGFADIGYHFVVEPDGRIYEGRDLRFMGAHAGYTREQRRGGRAKDPDFGALGVVLDGYFEQERPDERQLRAALSLIEDLRRRFGIPRGHVIGHGEVARDLVEQRGLTLGSSPTRCPGSALLRVLRTYRDSDNPAHTG